MFRVALVMQLDAKEAQAFTDAGANRGAPLSNARREHERVQPAERGGECAHPFLRVVAEQRHRIRRPDVVGLTREQVAHIGADLRHAKQPRLVIDHLMELRHSHLLRVREERHQPGVQISCSRAHHQPGHGREPHAGVDARASLYRSQAGAVAKMREDHATVGGFRPRGTGELFEEVGVRQAVKAVPLDALRVIAPRNREQLGDKRHRAVKRRVKAGYLRQLGMTLTKRPDQLDLARQMIRRIRHCATQFVDQFRGDTFRLRAGHPMHHAVSHSPHRRKLLPRFKPVDQDAWRGLVVRHLRVTLAGSASRCAP